MVAERGRPGVLSRRSLLTGAAAALASPRLAHAQGVRPLRIGVLNDQSGLLADLSGPGSVEAARMAVEEVGGQAAGRPVEVVSADHQNKTDLGAAILRRWFDVEGVDAAFDLGNSAISLAAQQLARERNRIVVHTTPASTELTGAACSPLGFHWVYDNYSNSAGLARALTRQGLDSWFFVTVDYAFGKSLEAEARAAIAGAGGTVLGSVKHPLGTSDFSSFLLQAQASGAKVIAFANNGRDLTNAIKQASEFGLSRASGGSQTLVAPVILITDVHSLGLPLARGLSFLTGFYWDLDEQTRLWSRAFFGRRRAMPTMAQAGTYSAVRHYLKAVEAVGGADGAAVADAMRRIPVADMFARNATLRPDGRMVHDMILAEVKSPDESRYPWDYYHVRRVVPGADAFRPLAEGGCPLVKV